MASSSHDLAAIARDPAWLAHRYDPAGDKVHFVRAPRETHRAATFLIDEYLPETEKPFVADRRAALAAAAPPAPIHFIFHSAYCCSTLLARAFDVEGVATTLKEPVILNDIQGWQSRGGEPARIAEGLDSALALLARPFAAGEQVIVKPSNLINPFAPAMLAMRPDARALLLYAPLRIYLGSIAKKGMWGRLWVRELFVKLGRSGLLDYGFSSEEILRQTDLQIAAIGWLGQHRLFGQLAERHPDRVRTLDSETLLARPDGALHALSDLYGLALDEGAAARLAESDAFTRHSKGGEKFGAAERQAEQRDAAAVHAEEIDKVAVWAEAVAESAGQSLDLPAGLLD
ncbi:MAG: hypothetical protein ACT4N8_04755 [Sphingosinicella sp.]|uniref:hypothetical protein n=1 Tax=Sphingosinicella sp. TaxID=1917971 RepID=UPI004037FF2E